MVNPKKMPPGRKGPSEMQQKWADAHLLIHQMITSTTNFRSCEVRLVGSAIEETKVDTPDEFDCAVSLKIKVGDVRFSKDYLGFAELYPERGQRFPAEWVDGQGRLVTDKIKAAFERECKEAAGSMDGVLVKEYLPGKAALPLILPIQIDGPNRGPPQSLDIDLVLAIDVPPKFQPQFALDWKKRSPLDEDLKKKIVDSGSGATVKTPTKTADTYHLWRVGYSTGPVFKSMPDELRLVYPKLKVLISDQVAKFCQEKGLQRQEDYWKHLMPSFNIKHAMATTYETFSREFNQWTPKMVALRTIRTMFDGIRKRNLKQFISDINMLKNIEDPDVAAHFDLYNEEVLAPLLNHVGDHLGDSLPVEAWIPVKMSENYLGPSRIGVPQGVKDPSAMAPAQRGEFKQGRPGWLGLNPTNHKETDQEMVGKSSVLGKSSKQM